MNFSDLLVLIGVLSAVGVVLGSLARWQFHKKLVNPHRGLWLLVAGSVFLAGLSVLRWEAKTQDASWLELLSALVTERRTTPATYAASSAILLSAIFVVLVLVCLVTLPRDPSTFHRPRHRRRAFEYYTNLKGGFDFALLVRACPHPGLADAEGQEIIELAIDRKKVQDRLAELPTGRTVDEQQECWKQTAAEIHRSMATLDNLVGKARQGRNRRLVFDVKYGGFIFYYLRGTHHDADDCIYLFVASLNQEEINNKGLEERFDLLRQALDNIERNVKL